MPFASDVNLTHSDDLRTIENVFGVWPSGYLGDAVNAHGLDSLFAPGAVVAAVPEPTDYTLVIEALALAGIVNLARKKTSS